jgi:F-type H+-transporting ATPase subunit c
MKAVRLACLVCVVFVVSATPVLAQDTPLERAREKATLTTSVFSGAAVAAGLGMGLTIIGAGIGLGRIGSAAMDGMSRQPEVAPRIQTAMLIIAAMLEGATLFSVLMCYLVGGSAIW